MSDFNSSLPVRTETNGDVVVQLCDASVTSQKQIVDAQGNAQVKIHGTDPALADQVVAVSEGGEIRTNGFYNVTTNTVPSSESLVAFTRAASPALTDAVKRLTAIQNSTVTALDVSLHDGAGAAFSSTNPLPVAFTDSIGTPVNNYATATVASAATSNHDYTVTVGKTLFLTHVSGAASGKMKAEVQIETGVATGVFTSFWARFNSTATPNWDVEITEAPQVAAGVRVRVIRTNKDNQSEDVYSTISGHEV